MFGCFASIGYITPKKATSPLYDWQLVGIDSTPPTPTYDWQLVGTEITDGEFKVYLNIVWYELEFFEKHKNEFLSRLHSGIFSDFEMSLADISVEHETF